MAPVESVGAISYLYSIATMAISLAVSTQYTNVTDRHSATHRRTATAALCSLARLQSRRNKLIQSAKPAT